MIFFLLCTICMRLLSFRSYSICYASVCATRMKKIRVKPLAHIENGEGSIVPAKTFLITDVEYIILHPICTIVSPFLAIIQADQLTLYSFITYYSLFVLHNAVFHLL